MSSSFVEILQEALVRHARVSLPKMAHGCTCHTVTPVELRLTAQDHPHILTNGNVSVFNLADP